MTDTLRVLIVDDEKPARKRIVELLAGDHTVEVIGECDNGADAAAEIVSQKPDVVFLDIQMPGDTGFDVIETVGTGNMPVTVFVTAFDRYALKAFDVHVLDYLLKPFTDERFAGCLERARERVLEHDRDGWSRKLVEALTERAGAGAPASNGPPPLDRIVLKRSGRVSFLKTDDIDWVEAAGVYVRIHAGAAVHLLRDAISGLDKRLDRRKFIRIHRSTIVNLDRVRELHSPGAGEFFAVMTDGTRLKISRSHRSRLEERLGQNI